MNRAIPMTFALFVAAGGAAHATPPETNLDDMKEICEVLAGVAPHLRYRGTRAEQAEDAAFFDQQLDFPVAVADLLLRDRSAEPTLIDRRLFHSGEDLVLADFGANLIPPSSFIAACRAARHPNDLRVGEIEPTALGGRLDRRLGAIAVISDGSTASVTWHHDGFAYFLMVTLRRDERGQWRLTGSRGWPCPAPL